MHIRIINLKKWFPGNDSFATHMARLCILREDFLFELQGAIESQSIQMKDEYGPAWRQLYFFRGLCHTAREIQSVVEGMAQKNFKHFLSKQSSDFVKYFDRFKAGLNQALKTIEMIRDEITAHILQGPTAIALENMSDKREGILQISSQTPTRTHYKFTGELLLAIMFKDISAEDQEKRQ